MPKSPELTPLQKKRILERAAAMQKMIDMGDLETEKLLGRDDPRSDPTSKIRSSRSTQKTVARDMKEASAQLGRVVKQEDATALRQEAKRDAANDSELAKLTSRWTLGKARRTRRKGGRKKTRRA